MQGLPSRRPCRLKKVGLFSRTRLRGHISAWERNRRRRNCTERGSRPRIEVAIGVASGRRRSLQAAERQFSGASAQCPTKEVSRDCRQSNSVLSDRLFLCQLNELFSRRARAVKSALSRCVRHLSLLNCSLKSSDCYGCLARPVSCAGGGGTYTQALSLERACFADARLSMYSIAA